MIRSVPLSDRVFEILFPVPQKGTTPLSWHEHVKKQLVPEIRQEVHQFYGSESRTLEAKYPGMDYTNPSHRMRLSRWPHHRRLFRAIDALELTQWEVYSLCDWEGTLLVKRRFEQQQNISLPDTTGDEVAIASSLGPLIDLEDYDEDLAQEADRVNLRDTVEVTGSTSADANAIAEAGVIEHGKEEDEASGSGHSQQSPLRGMEYLLDARG